MAYIAIARCASNFGIIDTEDNIVCWETKSTLVDYVEKEGIVIEGVTITHPADGDETDEEKAERCSVVINPIYYVPYENTQFGNSDSIFDIASRVTRGSQGYVEIHVEGVDGFTKYKIRPLNRVVNNATVSLGGFSFTADRDGILCKLSNGICTILSDEKFDSLFDGRPSASSIK